MRKRVSNSRSGHQVAQRLGSFSYSRLVPFDHSLGSNWQLAHWSRCIHRLRCGCSGESFTSEMNLTDYDSAHTMLSRTIAVIGRPRHIRTSTCVHYESHDASNWPIWPSAITMPLEYRPDPATSHVTESGFSPLFTLLTRLCSSDEWLGQQFESQVAVRSDLHASVSL